MESSPTDATLQVDPSDLGDLIGKLDLNKITIAASTNLSVVYRCSCRWENEVVQVAVKAIVLPSTVKANEFQQKIRHGCGIWRRLNHPNIVQFLGTASGKDFGSKFPCLVSMWMTNGTLFEHIERREAELLPLECIRLIKGSAAGLEYCIVHGDLHPGNVLIDDEKNPCLTNFGLSQALSPEPESLAYLYTNSVRAAAALWPAPELLHPSLFPNLEFQATKQSDIYCLGSIFFFVLSGQYPWKDREEAEEQLKGFQNPSRPPADIPDDVWSFIEQCWSPRDPQSRPSAKEVSSFWETRGLSSAEDDASRPSITLGTAITRANRGADHLETSPAAQLRTEYEECIYQERGLG